MPNLGGSKWPPCVTAATTWRGHAPSNRPLPWCGLVERAPFSLIRVDPMAAKIVETLRARTDLPIFVIAEFAGEMDVVAVLDAGADDCLAKPFGTEEMWARLRASVRRVRRSDLAPFVTDDFTIDVTRARRAFRRPGGSEIFLTVVEFRMIEVLLRHPGHLVPREQLLEEIWGERETQSPITCESSLPEFARSLNRIQPILAIC